MSNNILVLGASGFVGRHLVRALAEQGERVIAVTRHPFDFGVSTFEHVVAELRQPEDFAPLVARSRVVVHLATSSTPGSSAGQPITELTDNIYPTLSLLQAMQARSQTNLLYVSSGGSLYASGSENGVSETDAVNPRSYHGAGKIAAEYFIRAWSSQYGGAATVLRPSNLYGPGQPEKEGFGIIPATLGKALRSETLSIWGDGTAVRDYLYIDDFIALCMKTLSLTMPGGVRVFNASSGAGVSLNELFDLIEGITGKPVPRSYDRGRAVDATRIVMDSSRAREAYGWSASTSLIEGLRQTWRWFEGSRA
jgi:UDP-glucose 4-epimerase